MSEVKRKKRILVAAVCQEEYNHYFYESKNKAIIFRFRPGQRWEFCEEYPGDPQNYKISHTLFYELNQIGILKGVTKYG